MRIVRAPLRITLGGGGTDLPGYYEKYGGFLISAAIDKFIYMTGSRRHFDTKKWLSYSRLEIVEETSQIKHELLRSCLEKYKFDAGVEIHSISELAGNSGMGSSGSFLVCTLTLLNSLQKKEMKRAEVAELAASIEMLDLGRSCGKQDHYIAAFGGIVCLTIDKGGAVTVEDLPLDRHVVRGLQGNLLIYQTGVSREAEVVLKQQTDNLKSGKADVVSRLGRIKEIGLESRRCLLKGDIDAFGRLLGEHWQVKKEMQTDMTNPRIDEIYAAAQKAGMLGGKVMGAGGGGFFMFYVPTDKQTGFRAAMRILGLDELDWQFNFSGCEVIFNT
jgi:D-glycero-alpha-D-manno-heptose-7-phosphate kinase